MSPFCVVTVFANWSWNDAVTTGENGLPAVMLVGCVTNPTLLTVPAAVVKALLESPLKPVDVARSLYVPAVRSCVDANVATPLAAVDDWPVKIDPGPEST